MLRTGVLAFLVLGASVADAKILTVDFTFNSGSWTYVGIGPSVYGLSNDPTISGSMQLDTTKTDSTAFVGLNYTTGTRTWTLVDIDASSFVDYSHYNAGNASAPNYFLSFDQGNRVRQSYSGDNDAVIEEGFNLVRCIGCVTSNVATVPAVPEPAAWALMIGGFGLVGGALRTRRAIATA